MATLRLYHRDSFARRFSATVVAHATYAGRASVVLDQTGFYPEAGGQLADHGELHADGATAAVVDVQLDDADLATVTLTYQSRDGATTATTTLAALIAGPQRVDVGTDGNRLMVTALRTDDACDRGFVRGRWHALRPGLGRFLGVATDADGQRIGHLRGIWGQRGGGAQVFFGKYIDGAGRFRGLMVGSYADGGFRGRWLVGTGDHGLIHGLYRDGAAAEAIGGAFVGRWAETSCAGDLPAP